MRLLLFFLFLSFGVKSQAQLPYSNNTFIPNYYQFGKGQPILLINGGPGMSCNGFSDIANKIADLGYRTIIFDQRGTGKSVLENINNETITIDLMIDDMENLRKALKIDRWVVFGQSFGGLLATAYYAKHPESIEKIIFSSSAGVNLNFLQYIQHRLQQNLSKTQRDSLAYYQQKLADGDNSKATKIKRAQYLAHAYVYDKKFVEPIANRLLELDHTVNQLVVHDLMERSFDYMSKFTNSQIPVLILQGKNDIISEITAVEIAQSFGNSKVVLLDNCAHYGWLDSPKKYFNSIRDFLKHRG